MASLAEIRARLAAQQTPGKNRNQYGDNAVYPHWNIDEGKSVTIRFLEDANKDNPFFWVERAMIRLPFNGIKGETDTKQVLVRVPCMEMWGEVCPVLTEVRPWFNDPSLEQLGRDYWKKREYFFHGFVRENPLGEENAPENPIRRFIIGPQIFAIIKASLMDPELEELPTHHLRGLDFKVNKTAKGRNADYTTSAWARRERALTSEEQDAIEKYGIPDLASYLPKKPNREEVAIIKELFEASVDGQPYDLERWGQYFRPTGVNAPAQNNASPAPVSTPTVETKAVDTATIDDDVPFDTDSSATAPITTPTQGNSKKADDILAMIRARQQ